MTADQTGEFPQPGWALVRTNGIVPDGVYDLDTSSDGYYLTLLADPDASQSGRDTTNRRPHRPTSKEQQP